MSESSSSPQRSASGESSVTLASQQHSRLPLGTQLFRFIVSGGLAAIVDFGLLTVGMAAGLGHGQAKALSWVAGTITAYAINRRWTFQAGKSKRRFAGVMAIYLTTFIVQVGLFTWLYPVLVNAGLGKQLVTDLNWAQIAGFVIAQGVATVVNFIVQRWVIFKNV